MVKHFEIILTTVFLFLTPLGFAQDDLTAEQRIDTLFAKYNSRTPGVAVAIVKDGEVILKKGYGMANLEYDIPINPETIFHVASVSKQFTAFSIYLLENQGKISFEDDIRKYFPELPDYGTTIKIHHLLSHTSGLRDQWALLTLGGWRLDDVITTEQILKLATNQRELNFEPGTELSYCNTSFTLLAEIVQRVTPQTFTDFTQEHIFQPLGMGNTQFYDDYQRIVKNRAYSYEIRNGEYIKKKLSYSNVGPTSLFTTIEDLAKWSNNFINPIVGDVELLSNYNEVSYLNNGEPTIFRIIQNDTLYHAKGQLIRNYRGVNIIKHGGHDAGFRTFLARFPDENITIITLSNDEHYEIFARGLDIAEFFLEKKMAKKEMHPKSMKLEEEKEESYRTNLKIFDGKYWSDELSTLYKIELRDDKLVVLHQRLPDMELSQTGKNKFNGTNYFEFNIDFLTTDTGEVTGFNISNFGVKKLTFEKIE